MMKRGIGVWKRGDSASALCWLRTQCYSGCRTGNVSIVYALLQVHSNKTVVESDAISSAENWRTDELSRDGSVRDLRERYPEDLGGMKEIFFPPGMIERVIDDCDPRRRRLIMLASVVGGPTSVPFGASRQSEMISNRVGSTPTNTTFRVHGLCAAWGEELVGVMEGWGARIGQALKCSLTSYAPGYGWIGVWPSGLEAGA